jgi:trimeric autotransporter adhesin
MSRGWVIGGDGFARVTAVGAVMPLVLAAALVGGGRAVAAPRPGTSSGRQPGPAVTAGVISTVAGGVGGPGKATKVAISEPCDVSYAAGSFYVGDTSTVRKVDAQTDRLTTPAGDGLPGPSGNGVPAGIAGLGACGTAVDGAGNLVIADMLTSQVRVAAARTGTFYGQAMTAGDIYTVAGKADDGGFAGDGGLATKARLSLPESVTLDSAGNLMIADTGNNRIRVIAAKTGTFYQQAMKGDHIYTVAGDGTAGFTGNSGLATAAGLFAPQSVVTDGTGNLVIADSQNSRIRVVAEKTGTFYGQAMTTGHIYTVAGDGGFGFAGDGGPAAKAELNVPYAAAVDGSGNLVVADELNNRVRVVAEKTGTFYGVAMTTGHIYTVAGDGTGGDEGNGGPGTSAALDNPKGVAVDGAGNLLIADELNNQIRVLAGKTGTLYGQAMTTGHIYTVAGNGSGSFSGDGSPAANAQLAGPEGVAVDSEGNMAIADTNNDRVRVVAGTTGTFYGQAMTAGDVYTVAGNGIVGFSGDGGPGTAAELVPLGVALDGAGNLLIADWRNSRIRVVANETGTFYGQAMTAGDIYTVAGDGTRGFSGDGGPAATAGLANPLGVGVDAAGNLLIGDTGDRRIRVVAETTGTFYGQAMTTGDIYTVVGDGTEGFSGDGGPATSAELDQPWGVTVDANANLVIADVENDRIRVVAETTGTFYGQAMTAGDIYTVAGGGTGSLGDGGPATSATLADPDGVAVDAEGNLVIADTENDRIRVVAEKTGTFYGQAMTAGDIYTVAGDGTEGFSGDGGPATTAGLNQPSSVTVDDAGNLLIADVNNSRIRQVTG